MGKSDTIENKASSLQLKVSVKDSPFFKAILQVLSEVLQDDSFNNDKRGYYVDKLLTQCNALSEKDVCGPEYEEINKAIKIINDDIEKKLLSDDVTLASTILENLSTAVKLLAFEAEHNVLSFSTLYSVQKALDHYIYLNNNVKHDDRLIEDLLLGLSVECGELANSIKCFKHWSNKPADSRRIQLSEYVDVIHFILSLGNALNFSDVEIIQAYVAKYIKNIRRQQTNY